MSIRIPFFLAEIWTRDIMKDPCWFAHQIAPIIKSPDTVLVKRDICNICIKVCRWCGCHLDLNQETLPKSRLVNWSLIPEPMARSRFSRKFSGAAFNTASSNVRTTTWGLWMLKRTSSNMLYSLGRWVFPKCQRPINADSIIITRLPPSELIAKRLRRVGTGKLRCSSFLKAQRCKRWENQWESETHPIHEAAEVRSFLEDICMGTSVWVIGIFRSHGSCKGPHGLIIQFPWTYFSIMIIIKLLPSLLMLVALSSVCNFCTNVGKWQITNDLRLTSKVKPLPILATLPTVLQPSNLEISRSKVPQKIFKPPTFLKKKTKLQRVCLASRWWITDFVPASYICNLYLRDLIGRRAKFLTAGLAAVANGHIFQLDQVLRRFLVMKLTSGSRVSCVSLSQFICSRSAEANGGPEQQHFFFAQVE